MGNEIANIPNILTLIRIIMIPIFIVVFYLPNNIHYFLSASVFVLACFTDWLDGFLARKLKQESQLGEFLDPVADKLIVASALVLLVQSHATIWLAIPAVVIVCREILISALREWMAELGKRTSIAVSYVGKVKTTFQMVAIIIFLTQPPKSVGWIMYTGYVLLYIAVILTIWSMLSYVATSFKIINIKDR